MEDYIISVSALSGAIRAYGALTTATVEKARQIHQTSPVVTAALGRTLTGTLLMGSMDKEGYAVTVHIKGNGPLPGVLATTEGRGMVKGYPSINYIDLPLKANGKLDVSGAIGEGVMTVTKNLGMKEPYTGQVPLRTSEIAEDFAYYYAKSEQIPSAVALGVLVGTDYRVMQSGGLIIQLMPGAPAETADLMTNRMNQLSSLTARMQQGQGIDDILAELLKDMDMQFLDRIKAGYHCHCSKDRMKNALRLIGRDEIEDILSNEKETTLTCHFCNASFTFKEDELQLILTES